MQDIKLIDQLILNLNAKTSLDFETVVADAFNAIGFKAETISDNNEHNPDVMIEANKCKEKYLVAIECYANVGQYSQAPKEKVSQIRANGPRYLNIDKYKGKFNNLYLCLLSRGGFQKATIEDSNPDVVLFNFELLIRLLNDLKLGITYSQDELEPIFRGHSIKSDDDNDFLKLRMPKLERFYYLGLICYILDSEYKRSNSIFIENLKGQIIANLRNNRVKINEQELNNDILLLAHPLIGFFRIEGNTIKSLNLSHPELFRKLGRFGSQINHYFNFWREKLRPKRITFPDISKSVSADEKRKI